MMLSVAVSVTARVVTLIGAGPPVRGTHAAALIATHIAKHKSLGRPLIRPPPHRRLARSRLSAIGVPAPSPARSGPWASSHLRKNRTARSLLYRLETIATRMS